jgi:hypothetical protein
VKFYSLSLECNARRRRLPIVHFNTDNATNTGA